MRLHGESSLCRSVVVSAPPRADFDPGYSLWPTVLIVEYFLPIASSLVDSHEDIEFGLS